MAASRRWTAALLLLVGVAVTALAGMALAPPMNSASSAKLKGDAVRIVAYNAGVRGGESFENFLDWAWQHEADLVCVMERPRVLSSQVLDHIASRWPYGRPMAEGSVVFGRLRLRRIGLWPPDMKRRYELFTIPVFAVDLRSGRQVTLVVTHQPSPRRPRYWRSALQKVTGLGMVLAEREAGDDDEAAVVVGDFNSTPLGRPYRTFVEISGFRDANPATLRRGTWPALLPSWFGLPIDHCFIGESVRMHDYQVGPAFGSDHRPILVELSVPPVARSPAGRSP